MILRLGLLVCHRSTFIRCYGRMCDVCRLFSKNYRELPRRDRSLSKRGCDLAGSGLVRLGAARLGVRFAIRNAFQWAATLIDYN